MSYVKICRKGFLWVVVLFGLASRVLCGAAPAFTNGVSQGTVSNSVGLSETSGLAASRNNVGVLWTHNDKGDANRIFALDVNGRKLGVYTLTGGANEDYEDIGVGPGPVANVSYLYVADIGDNNSDRSSVTIYQIPEPAVYARQAANPVTTSLKGVRAITLTYPGGARDAEAMFVDPVTGDLFIASKASTSRIYTAKKSQLDVSNNFTMAFVRTLGFNSPSGADISPSGNEIIIRQEDFARLWTRTNGQSISNALGGTAIKIPVVGTPTEPNGEAIGFDANGGGYFTLSDSATSQPLYYFARTSSDGPSAPRTLIAAGSGWKYFDQGTDQGTAWQSPGFDDASWSNGVAQFGYGDGDEKTIVRYGGDANNKFITTYFRSVFLANDTACITNLVLKLVVDDGAGVYLNGTAVVYENLAPGAAYNTPATAMPAALQATWHSYSINPRLLLNGTNTLAAEIHQSSVTSSNISFDLQLVARDAPCVTSLSLTNNQQPRLVLYGPSNVTATVQASQSFTGWSNRASVILTNGRGTFVDSSVTNFSRRFYRVAP